MMTIRGTVNTPFTCGATPTGEAAESTPSIPNKSEEPTLKVKAGEAKPITKFTLTPSFDMSTTTKFVANKLKDDDNAMSLFDQASLYGVVTKESIATFSLNTNEDRSKDSGIAMLKQMLEEHGKDGVLTKEQFKEHYKPLNNVLNATVSGGL